MEPDQSTVLIDPADEEIRDFTHAVKLIRFKIAPDVFQCAPGLPVLSLIEFASLAEKLENAPTDEYASMFDILFGIVLTEDSFDRFRARLGFKKNPDDPDEVDLSKKYPIDFEHLNDLIPWILEKYGMRPTEPSSDSSTGSESPDGGTNSTATAPAVV